MILALVEVVKNIRIAAEDRQEEVNDQHTGIQKQH